MPSAPTVNRRRSIGEPVRKPGWQVRASVAEAVRRAVEAGEAESQNAFVERAILRELQELRRQRVYQAYAQAASDQAFLEDMNAITRAFEPARHRRI
ncbi:MAG: hypothetical protein ACT4O1_16105 [Gemmatimonadota bacterium]